MKPVLEPREGRWIARPRKPRWALRTVGWSAIGFNLAFNLLGSFRREFPILGILWWGILVGVLVLWLLDLVALRKSAKDRTLLDGGFGDQFPVEMTTVVDDARIATDRGVVWFADGLMGFSGEASSFVLAASDLAPQWIRAKRHPTGRELPPNALVLLGAPRAAYLHIAPLIGHGKTYRRRFGRFMAAAERPEGERFWPPLDRYEEPTAGLEALR